MLSNISFKYVILPEDVCVCVCGVCGVCVCVVCVMCVCVGVCVCGVCVVCVCVVCVCVCVVCVWTDTFCTQGNNCDKYAVNIRRQRKFSRPATRRQGLCNPEQNEHGPHDRTPKLQWTAGWVGAEINLIVTDTGKTTYIQLISLKKCIFFLASEDIAQRVKHMSQVHEYMPHLFALYPRVMHVQGQHKTVAYFYVATYQGISQN
jgi:hypothetical protein